MFSCSCFVNRVIIIIYIISQALWSKCSRVLSVKYCSEISKILCQKLLDHAKKFSTDVLKTASNRAIQKIAEATSDLIGTYIYIYIYIYMYQKLINLLDTYVTQPSKS